MRGFTILATSLALLSTACDDGGRSDDPGTHPESPSGDHACEVDFTGEEIYLGYFFGQGEVAKRIPMLDEMAWKSEDQAISEINRISRDSELGFVLDTNTIAAGVLPCPPQGCLLVDDALHEAGVAKIEEVAAENEQSHQWERADAAHTAKHVLRKVKAVSSDGACDISSKNFPQLVVRRIADSDPGFFSRFATEMQSGSPLRVDNAIREGVRHTLDAYSAIADEHAEWPNTALSGDLGTGNGLGVYTVLLVQRALDVNLNIELDSVVVYTFATQLAARTDAEANLHYSELIGDIAALLDCRCDE